MSITRLFIFFLCFGASLCRGQTAMSFKDTIKKYNSARVITDLRGAEVLGIWGIANIGLGGAGYLATQKNDQGELKYFSEMNMAWGVVNTSLSGFSILRSKRQVKERIDANKMFHEYRQDKKILLVNLGLDVAFAGIGAMLVQKGNHDATHADMYKGFGKSLVVQGVFLLGLDNFMFSAHQKYNARWMTILDEMRFTGNGLGYVHTFKGSAERMNDKR